ncbi:MAG: hypothetical protein C4343_06860, partial [Chloroflexota bacterium]
MEPIAPIALVALVAIAALAFLTVWRLARARGRELDRIRELLGLEPTVDPTIRIRELLQAAAPDRIER